MPDDESDSQTISAIDSNLNRVQSRLREVRDNLHDGLYGESPVDEATSKVESAIPTASIASIARRTKEIHDLIFDIEAHVKKIHTSSNPVAG